MGNSAANGSNNSNFKKIRITKRKNKQKEKIQTRNRRKSKSQIYGRGDAIYNQILMDYWSNDENKRNSLNLKIYRTKKICYPTKKNFSPNQIKILGKINGNDMFGVP